jgi:Amt family ammonium transporter
VTTFILFAVIKATVGLRVAPDEEVEGLDVLEHGSPGYAPDVVSTIDVAPVGASASTTLV